MYNLHVRAYLVGFLALALLFTGCKRNIQNTEAVRRGVLDYLAKRTGLDVNNMQVEIASVNFRENEADAVVSFRPKGSNAPGQSMQMRYTLERQNNEWVVKGRAGGTGESMGNMPGGHPPIGAGEPMGAPPAAGAEQPKPETKK
jgi:hypothetical protein